MAARWETVPVPDHTARLTRAHGWVAVSVLGVAVALTALPVPAIASQGSIPAEVDAFAHSSSGLQAQLDDLFGVGSGGTGIDFNETTEIGQLNRVFVFTDDFVAGVATDTPVERRNEWTAPVKVNDVAVGLATIWINPATTGPELAEFVRGTTVADALAAVADDAFLVRDDEVGAWFSLESGTLTPLVSGSSAISSATPLTVYQGVRSTPDATATAPAPADSGTLTSVVLVALAVAGAAAILAVPRILARRRQAAGPH